MKLIYNTTCLTISMVVILTSLSSSIVCQVSEIMASDDSIQINRPFINSKNSASTSTGDFLGFYTTLQSPSPVPYPIDVISFPALNGSATTISNAWSTINFTQTNFFLPSNTSAYDLATRELVCLISGEQQLLTYQDNPMTSNLFNLSPAPSTAPVYLNGTLYGIDIENGGYASGAMVDFDLVSIDPLSGIINGIMPGQFTTLNPGFYTFDHESMSSATNGIDEVYFLSGTNLITITNPNPFNPTYCWMDLEPANSPSNFHKFYGLEYRSPGKLMAIRETDISGIPQTDLVEIDFNSTTCTINGIVTLYDLQNNLLVTPGGWIVNSEYYSSTYNSCADKYYVSTRYDMNTSSRLVEIDISLSTHFEQILPKYLFGIEWKKTNCPCVAAFSFQSTDSCQNYQFINNSSGPGPLTYNWNFGDPASAPNNTSNLQNPTHQFTTCGTYNVCLTVIENLTMCDSTICHQVMVQDIIPPTALCKNGFVVALDINCMASITPGDIDNGSFDNCLLQSLSVSPNTFNACGQYPVTLTVTDWCGNTAVCMTQIQVVDTLPPLIICPPDLYLTTTGANCSMTVPGGQLAIITADNCGPPLVTYTITGASNYTGTGNASGLSFNAGTSVVTYTATDNCGNVTSCSFNVVVDCICNCQNNLVQNSGFDQGSIMGNLGSNPYPGHTNNWFKGSESPWIDGTTFCCDPFSIYFWAYASGGESIYQQGIPFLAGHTYKISYCSKSNLLYGFQTTNAPVPGFYNPYNCSNCEQIGISPQASSLNWNTYTMPLWTAQQNADVLVIRGIGNGCCGYHNKGWIDNICVQEIFYKCCDDQKAFDENSSRIVNVQSDQSEELVSLNIGPLLECNRIAYIDWGDGTPILLGPFDANTSLTHIYPDTNVYGIQYLVQEFNTDDSSQVCFEKLFTESVQIKADSCSCNAFSSMFIRSSQGSMSIPVNCGTSELTLTCPPIGSGFTLTGLFECSGTSCRDTSTISWRISGPQESEVGLASTNPYFSIDLLPTYFTQPGEYTLSISGFCGNENCTCEIQFNVECPDLCPCEEIQLETNVNVGFLSLLQSNSCDACFSPIALSDCETVEWYIDNPVGIPNQMSAGNQTFCHSFPGPGSYTVFMVVNRKNADGSECATFTKSKTVTVSCQTQTDCDALIIGNPGFGEGAMSGGLNSSGTSTGWNALSGAPEVMEGAAGSHDAWTILLSGNLDSASILSRMEPICLEQLTGFISVRIGVTDSILSGIYAGRAAKPKPCDQVKLELIMDDDFTMNRCNGIDCYSLASVSLSDLVPNEWYELQIPYDIRDWEVPERCGNNNGILVRPAAYVTNALSSDQGGVESFSFAQLDNICFGETLVAIQKPAPTMPARLYPNPTKGELILEWMTPTTQLSIVRIVDLTGKIVQEIKVESGVMIQRLNVNNLTSGMYFLQSISEARLMTVNKFVKN